MSRDPLSHVASWLKTSGEPAAAADDNQIRALFSRWIDAHSSLHGLPDDAPQEEFRAACRAIADIADSIVALPAAGAPGLAIKAYLRVHSDLGAYEPPGALSARSADGVDLSIIADVMRFVPELAALHAPAVA